MKIFGIHGLLKEHKQQAERGGKSPQKREVATLNAGDKTMGAVIGVWGFLAIVLMFCGIGTVADRLEDTVKYAQNILGIIPKRRG